MMSEGDGDICLAEVVPRKLIFVLRICNSNREIALRVGLVLIGYAISSLKLACGTQEPKLSRGWTKKSVNSCGHPWNPETDHDIFDLFK